MSASARFRSFIWLINHRGLPFRPPGCCGPFSTWAYLRWTLFVHLGVHGDPQLFRTGKRGLRPISDGPGQSTWFEQAAGHSNQQALQHHTPGHRKSYSFGGAESFARVVLRGECGSANPRRNKFLPGLDISCNSERGWKRKIITVRNIISDGHLLQFSLIPIFARASSG